MSTAPKLGPREDPRRQRPPRPTGRDEPDLSVSVRRIWESSEIDIEATNGYLVTRSLLRDPAHRSYGEHSGPAVDVGEAPPEHEARPLAALISDVRTLYRPQEPGQLDGRKVVFGLALIDPSLRERLGADGFLAKLGREVELHENLSGRGKALYLPDAVPTLSDQPSKIDQLGRKAFAEVLGARMNDEFVRSKEHRRSAESFMVHLEGPWGSGKTSLLNFLRDYLRRRRPRWLIVDFNAWQHQRAGAPWWLLMAAVQRAALRDWWPWPPYFWSKLRLLLGSLMWRAWLARGWLLVLAAACALLAVLIATGGKVGDADVARIAGTVGSIIGVTAAVIGLARSFSAGTAGGAETFVQQTRDPMKRLQRRFNRIVKGVGRPIAVFIDDLDRCKAEYVVDMLEGIQTILRDAPVSYVVAADRHWLYQSYGQVYEKHLRDDPGRPLGHLFLEKTFQLSTSLPRLSTEERDEYWNDLIFPAESNGAEAEVLRTEIEKSFADAHSEPEVMGRLDAGESDSVLERRLRREAAVRRLASPELLRQTEHTLTRFADLLEPNPRAMKRLVNAYGVERAIQILEGHSQDVSYPREKLALWTIVKSRWPLLAEHLADHPDQIEKVKSREVPAEIENDKDRPYLARLYADREVNRVVTGEGLQAEIQLDEHALTLFVQGPSPAADVVHT